MKDELMRRISRAIDAEGGVASDADLSAELRTNPEAAKYAKDLSRLDVWLGSWPLPEPDAAAMEALASRIEQRLDDKLAAIMDPTLPPDFDDDDSLRDATAGLLQSGEHTVASGEYTLETGSARTSQPEIVSDSQLEVVSMPMLELVSSPQLEVVRDSNAPAGVSHEAPAAVSHEAPAAVSHEAPAAVSHEAPAAVSHEAPAAVSHEATAAGPAPEPEGPSTLAKVQLKKREVRGAVEEHAAESSGEPRSATDLQERLSTDAPKKKKKKKAADAAPSAAKVLPLKELAGKKDDRISIPTPAARMGQGTLAPVKDLPKEKERSGGGAMWWMAAAAAVGLGIFGASSLLSTSSAPSASPQQTITATAATAPMAARREEPPPPPVAPAEAPADVVAPMTATPMAAPAPVAPPMAPPPATIVAQAPTTGYAGPVGRPRATPVYDGLAESDAPTRRAAARIATGPSATGSSASGSGGGRGALLMDEGSGGAVAHSRASASPPMPTTTPAPSAAAPAPPPASAAEAASLPDTPDRDAIQQALGAVTPAVQACAAGDHGVADVDIVIASTGRVTTATVNGRFAGTPVGSCIARAVRGARFPRFAQPRYEVTYPFHL